MRTAGGFTLIELVMVILLLGIMATFASQFIGIGTQIYGDASSREQLMSDARFAMERLNREVRDALPGSERIETLDGTWSDSGPCLRFWPISTSSRYLALNRAQSGSTSTLELVMATPASAVDPMSPDANAVKAGDLMVVFPMPTSAAGSLANGCEYGRCVARVTEVLAPVSGAQTVRYTSGETLAGISPGSRVYFANQQIRYCVEGSTMTRSSAAIGAPVAAGVLMAESLRAGNFYREVSAFNAEGEFGLRLVFERKGEAVTFNHKLGVFNVPERRQSKKMGGSALMIALFVIVVMAMLAAVMGRFLLDSSEKNAVEVRSVRALLAAQSGLEVALYRLFPNRTAAQPQPSAVCESSRTISFIGNSGLVDCQAVVQCRSVSATYNGVVSTGYRLQSVGTCGLRNDLTSASPDFRVSRTLMVEAYDGG